MILAVFIPCRDSLYSDAKKDGEKAVYGGDSLRIARDENIKKIEFVLWHKDEIREALEEAACTTHTGGAPSGHARIVDTTATQAIKLAEGVSFVEWFECPRGRRRAKCFDGCKELIGCRRTLEKPSQWLSVIGAVERFCEQDALRKEVFRRRYLPGRNRRGALLSSSTYYFVLGEIRSYALQAAAQAQVIKVF